MLTAKKVLKKVKVNEGRVSLNEGSSYEVVEITLNSGTRMKLAEVIRSSREGDEGIVVSEWVTLDKKYLTTSGGFSKSHPYIFRVGDIIAFGEKNGYGYTYQFKRWV